MSCPPASSLSHTLPDAAPAQAAHDERAFDEGMPSQAELEGRVRAVLHRIDTAARAAGRERNEVRVLLASKTQCPQTITAAVGTLRTELAAIHSDTATSAHSTAPAPTSASVPTGAAASAHTAEPAASPLGHQTVLHHPVLHRPVLIGENRVQELVTKAPLLQAELTSGTIAAHLIGPLQKNKINAALRYASCIHSIDSLDLAQAISRRIPPAPAGTEHSTGSDLRQPSLASAPASGGGGQDVMVQVNVSGEASKFGASPDDAYQLACAVAKLPGMRLVGLMAIGAYRLPDGSRPSPQQVTDGFAHLRLLRDRLLASGCEGTSQAYHLSMGMSADLELAIAQGATILRIGSAIFGRRPPASPVPDHRMA